MPHNITPYRDLKIVTPEPLTGAAGQMLNDNFKTIADDIHALQLVGVSGYSGFSGKSGFSGATGPQGISGYSGQSGYDGCAFQYTFNLSYSGATNSSGIYTIIRDGDTWTGTNSGGGAAELFSNGVNWHLVITASTFDSPSQGSITFTSPIASYPNCPPTTTTPWTRLSGDNGTLLSVENSYTGTSGFSGVIGRSGFSGFSGATGSTGATGTSGFSGYSGPAGATGSQGQSGFSGYSGPAGATGSTGASGQSGYSGYSGKSGYSGFSGQASTGTAIVQHKDGSYTVYQAASNTDSARGTALLNAVAALSQYDHVILSGGNFDISTNTILLLDNVSLSGAGKIVTTISSSAPGLTSGAILQVGGDNVTIAKIKVYATLTDGTLQIPIGGQKDQVNSGGYGQFGFLNLLVTDCHIEGLTDGIYLFAEANEIFSLRVQDTSFLTKWDALACYNFDQDNISGDIQAEIVNCEIHTTGWIGFSNCLTAEQGTWRLWSCKLQSDGGNPSFAINQIDNSDSGLPTSTVYLHGCNLSSSGTTSYDLNAIDGIYVDASTVYDETKVANSSAVFRIGQLPTSFITTGTMATARLGTGTANSTVFLRGDSTWATGVAGTSGFSGYSGQSGFSGATGATGSTGSTGTTGTSGFSGYSGATGATGSTGATGTSGFSGYSGTNGSNGATGTSGFSGYSGLSGYSGFSGLSGYSGYSGKSGYSGYSGASATETRVLLTSNQTTTDSTGTVAVTNMTFSVGANETWIFDIELALGDSSTGGAFFGFTVPNAPTYFRAMWQATTNATTAQTRGVMVDNGDTTTSFTLTTLAATNSQLHSASINGSISNAGNAGSVQLVFASTNGTGTITVQKGSWLRATRIS